MDDAKYTLILCKKCLVAKELDQFPKDSRYENGRRKQCKECHNATRMAWIDANRDKVKALGKEAAAKRRSTKEGRDRHNEASKLYYTRHRESALAAAAKYRDAHNAKFVARIRKWQKANPGAVKSLRERWFAANPGAKKAYNQNRRTRLKSTGKLSKDIIPKLFALQKGKCPCCAQPLGSDHHLDHKMPLALGGSNTDGNMQLLRAQCNLQKSAKHPVDFMQSRGFLL